MKLKKHYINWIVFACVLAFCVALDLVTKVCFEGMEKSLIGNFLWISSVHNEGAAFSMLEGARWLFVALSFVALAVIFFVIFGRKFSSSTLFVVSLSMMAGGIVGNLVDRFQFGYVRDFIDFRFSGFAIFNFADSALCIGCGLFVLWLILDFVKQAKDKKNKQQQNMVQENAQKSDEQAGKNASGENSDEKSV